MPRARRVYLEDSVYFVTLEGPYDEKIFKETSDYIKYLQLLNDCKSKFDFKLYAYALLPDRLHLLIQANESFPVSQIMQQTTPLYTKYFNQRYERKGPLFQKRFRSVLVEKESYLSDVIRYIHLMPTRYRLAASIEEYPYTSHKSYMRNHTNLACHSERSEESQARSFSPSGFRMTATEAISSDAKFPINLDREVQEVFKSVPFTTGTLEGQTIEFFDKKLSRGFILGSDAFEAAVKKRLKEEESNQETAKSSVPVPDMSKRIWLGTGILTFALACITFSFYLYFAKPFTQSPNYEAFSVKGVQLQGPMDEIKRILSELSNLDGTIWEVELIRVLPNGEEKRIKDQIRFTGTNFESHYFSSQGFSSSNYTVTIDRRGTIMWETTQKNDKGETLSWQGDWQAGKMVGKLNYYPTDQNPQSFSFLSNSLTGAQKG